MFFIGASIYLLNLKSIKFSWDVVWILTGRFIISPLLVILMVPMFHIPRLMGSVFVIQAAMPAMANSAIIARAYDSDYNFCFVNDSNYNYRHFVSNTNSNGGIIVYHALFFLIFWQ